MFLIKNLKQAKCAVIAVTVIIIKDQNCSMRWSFFFQVILLKPKNQTCAIFKKKNVHIALGKYWKHMVQNLEAVVLT